MEKETIELTGFELCYTNTAQAGDIEREREREEGGRKVR